MPSVWKASERSEIDFDDFVADLQEMLRLDALAGEDRVDFEAQVTPVRRIKRLCGKRTG